MAPCRGPVTGSLTVPKLTPEEVEAVDAAHLWHPYSRIGSPAEAQRPLVVTGASGPNITVVRDGRSVAVLDGMSSWWSCIHGHGHPVLDRAVTDQLASMSHVMFGA